jgi:hypothetical protein
MPGVEFIKVEMEKGPTGLDLILLDGISSYGMAMGRGQLYTRKPI